MYICVFELSQGDLKDPPLQEPKKDKIKDEEQEEKRDSTVKTKRGENALLGFNLLRRISLLNHWPVKGSWILNVYSLQKALLPYICQQAIYEDWLGTNTPLSCDGTSTGFHFSLPPTELPTTE
jgi:hypothetical protein